MKLGNIYKKKKKKTFFENVLKFETLLLWNLEIPPPSPPLPKKKENKLNLHIIFWSFV